MPNLANLDLELIAVYGEDACSFLHAQLTQSVNDIKPNQARLFGYCNNKGRLIANGIIFIYEHNFYMLVNKTISNILIKKLSMFILRAKVNIHIISKNISYQDCNTKEPFLYIDNLNNCINITWLNNYMIKISPDNQGTKTLNLLSMQQFEYDNIKSGIFFINEKNTELYVPQMLNLEKLGGVSFSKGCYPGQEIVARSQYLGTIKKNVIYAFTVFEQSSININDCKIINQNNEQIADIVSYCLIDNKLHLLLCIRKDEINNQIKLIIDNKQLNLNYQFISYDNYI